MGHMITSAGKEEDLRANVPVSAVPKSVGHDAAAPTCLQAPMVRRSALQLESEEPHSSLNFRPPVIMED